MDGLRYKTGYHYPLLAALLSIADNNDLRVYDSRPTLRVSAQRERR